MTPDLAPEDELAAQLAKDVIARVAPHELPIFRATSVAYFQNAEQDLKGRSRDEMLGFGAESLVFLSPFALAIAKQVVLLLMEDVAKNLKERSAEAVARWVRRMFRGADQSAGVDESAAVPEGLTRQQLSRVRELAFSKGKELDLSEDDAALLADGIVGSLVVGS